MDELVHHCIRELAFEGDLGEFPSHLQIEARVHALRERDEPST